MKKINIAAVRADFPVLSSQMKGHPLAYFDNGATGLTPLPVINAIESYYRNSSCNIHRGIYELSEQTTEKFESSRAHIAAFINAASEEEIVFTHGATESINIVAYGWGDQHIHAGDEIVITEMEHHANLVPWQQLAARKSAYLKFIPIDPKTGCLQLDKLEQILTPKTKLLAVSGMSNVTGVENPLPRLVKAARAVDALVLIDAAQYVVHADVDVQKLDVDFLVFSGHKLYGPTGIGVLYGKREVLESMSPFISGGDMILDVKKEHSTFRETPYRLEAGTPNIAGALGLSAAITYIKGIGMPAIQDYEKTLMKYALQRAEGIKGMHVYGPLDTSQQGSVFSFTIDEIHPHDLGTVLNEHGVAVRAGFHCAQPYVEAMGSHGTVRATFSFYNTVEEIDRFFEAVLKGIQLFKDF
ncbi:MAG TPA: SufS family cysteine desulfurase [Clostridia bacterium]|nr:SufS family cysteine desulfurase [Clostridia bacterium]